MAEIIQILIGAFVVGFSGAAAPGPMLTLVISSAAEKGFWTSFFIVIGHSLLELVVIVSLLLGLVKYLDNPVIVKVIGILGGVFLLYIGIDLIISVARGKNVINFKKLLKECTITGKSTFIITFLH